MKRKIKTAAFSGLIALGILAGGAPAASAAAIQAGGAISTATSNVATTNAAIVDVGWKKRRHNGGRHWKRRHNGRHHSQRPRHYGGHSGFYFQFGAPRYVIPAPRYVRPRYAPRANLSRHVAWCENHYRSYRRYDNTFQPYHGPRKRCISPYRR